MNSNMSGSGEAHRVAKKEDDIKSEREEVKMISSPENKLKRKRHNRHTMQQIQAMEEFFKDCPHPDSHQRIELGKDIGIEPLQVKFWFQNKRTQMKMKHEHEQNANLVAENKKLHAERVRLREELKNATCPACGCMATIVDVPFEERKLRIENARLIDEINRISGLAANYVGKPLTNPSSSVLPATNLGIRPMFRGQLSKGKGAEDSDDEHENNNKP
ncbi:Homeobox-leucine zipper protein MERISTEM L1 [Castilleja foliolosa]|uniref:Homeobox-leucine zipper protein MERISTEM L1 n=1 Tax=Castilleja foliolosa TaxID=1961234 RepID=A0ABD3CZP9_9LAMI